MPLPPDAFPTLIETARLRLRKPRSDEEPLFVRLMFEAYATRIEPLTREQARAFGAFMYEHWDLHGFGFLAIDVRAHPAGSETIGHAGLKYVDAWPGHRSERQDAIELGFSIAPSARGFGYVTEAGRAILAAAFEAFDVPLIHARCNADNPKSAAALLRCGFAELEPADKSRRFEIERPRV